MMTEEKWATFWLIVAVACMVGAWAFLASVRPSLAHDEDHNNDEWYGSLLQPDNPNASCCGLADAYWCDDYYARDGKAYCRITDDRDDAPLKRPHVDIGTEILIPPYKLKWEQSGKPIGNPTGHSVVFLSPMLHVFCFVQAGGV